jgi:MFS family permease
LGNQALEIAPASSAIRARLTDPKNRGWLVVAVVFLGAALAIGSSNYAFSLFVEPIEDSFGWRRTYISASLSFMALGSLAGPFLGTLMDRHGARPIMTASLVLIGLSFVLRPLMTELWHWYGLSALQFIAFSGAAILPAGRLVGLWFPEKRGRVMGITMMGNNFGGLAIPPLVGLAMGSTGSWGTAYFTLGLATIGLAVLTMVVIAEPGPRAKAQAAKAPSAKPGTGSVRSRRIDGWTFRQAARTRAFFAITVAILLGNFTYTTVLAHVSVHLEGHGISETSAIWAISVLAASGMAGKVLLGYMTERVAARFVMMVSFGGQIVGIILMLTAVSGGVMWLSVGLFGFFMGSFGALAPLLVQDSFGIKNFGSIMGIISATTVVSFGIGPILAGLSFDFYDGYGPVFIGVAVAFGVAAIALTQAATPSPSGPTPGELSARGLNKEKVR